MKRPVVVLIGALVVAACNDRVTSPATLFQASGGGQGVILGQVLGRTFAPPGDSSLIFTDKPVARARVDAFLIDSTPPDSGGPRQILVASTLTGTVGRFQLTPLVAGIYRLTATPPAGSPFGPGVGSVFVNGRGVHRTLILLHAVRDTLPPPPPDTLPPPPDTSSSR